MSRTFRVGEMTIHQLTEFVAPFMPAIEMLPRLTPEVLDANRGWMGSGALDEDDHFLLVYQSYVVRTPQGVVLIDTGVGNGKDRPRPEWHMRDSDRYLQELAEVGLSVDDIDYVLCTHFHPDHVGWNTRLIDGRWTPTFPCAQYIFVKTEVAEAERKHAVEGFEPYIDSVLPIIEAGRALLVPDAYAVNDYVRLEPTHGHTSGHSMVLIGRDSDLAVMTGDMFHVSLQLRHPELAFVRDVDPDASTAARRTVFERFSGTSTLVCTGHLPAPSIGHLRCDGDGFVLDTLSDDLISEGEN